MSFKLTNTGKIPILITVLITSCGCLEINDGDHVFSVLPGKERILTFRYNSAKNIGYVKHYITLYGNFTDKTFKEIVLDINVVPNAEYTRDYEELYQEQIKQEGGIKNFVDGEASNKGYYLD